MRPQQRIRRMRRGGRRPGRSADGVRQNYYDGDLRTAREAAGRAARRDNQAGRPS